MIAQRFRPLGWVAGVATAATGLYLVSLQVAAERGKLDAVEAQIADARRALRALQTELGTRASLRQLEAWNGDVLSLSAPKAKQFAASADQLVAFNLTPGDAGPTPTALLAESTTAPPAPMAPATPAAAPVAPKPVAAPSAPKAKSATPTAPVRTAKADRTQRVAMLDQGTLSDLGRTATTERRPRP